MSTRADAWWTWPTQRAVMPPRRADRTIGRPRRSKDHERLGRLNTLAEIASEAWTARDEDDLFAAIGSGCAELGLNAHIGIADPTGEFLSAPRKQPTAAPAVIKKVSPTQTRSPAVHQGCGYSVSSISATESHANEKNPTRQNNVTNVPNTCEKHPPTTRPCSRRSSTPDR